jgi:hypothetical protein
MTDTYTPPRFAHRTENVPEELKADPASWVCCDENKVPLVATLSGAVYAASSTDPNTWRSYEEALGAWYANEWSFAGVGRVIRAEEDLVGADFDKCLDPETGELTPWAASMIERLDSHAEVSPSGTGVKVWVKAPTITRAHVKPGLEIYPRGRYFTVTGLVLGETREIARRDEELEAIVAEEFPRVDRDRTAYDGPKRAPDLLDYLEKANVEIFSERSDGTAERVYSIRCPWFEEHTGGDESGTRVGQYPDGATFFRCEHAHCREVREWRQFKAECDPIVYLGRCRRAKGRLR